MADTKSLYNTPPIFTIYVAGLCFEYMLNKGGLEVMEKMSTQKSQLRARMDFILVLSRSRINVVILLANKDLDAKYIAEAAKEGLHELKGHGSVGGFRASLYNGITLEDVNRLVNLMNLSELRILNEQITIISYL